MESIQCGLGERKMNCVWRGLGMVALLGLLACQPEMFHAPPTPEKWVVNGTDIRQDKLGGELALTDGQGKSFSLQQVAGKVVLLSFGYTHCPDVCPLSLITYRDVMLQLGEQAKETVVVFVSVDPERDTPELLGKYVKQFHPDFIGLTDTTGGQNIKEIKQQYKVISAKAQQQSDKVYLVDHTAGTYILNQQGKAVIFEPYGKTAAEIADDVRILLK